MSLFVIGSAIGVMLIARHHRGRFAATARSVAAALEGGWQSLSDPHWRLLGAVGFQCLDIAALWAACRATGHHVGALPLAVAYFIGYVATLIPMPAGLAVLDSGLAGALVLYGFSPAASVSAVLAYHAIAIWVPGSVASWHGYQPEPDVCPTRLLRPLIHGSSCGLNIGTARLGPPISRAARSSPRRGRIASVLATKKHGPLVGAAVDQAEETTCSDLLEEQRGRRCRRRGRGACWPDDAGARTYVVDVRPAAGTPAFRTEVGEATNTETR